MPAYVVVQFTVVDRARFEEYAVASRHTIRTFGGAVVARGTVESLGGTATHEMGAVLVFPDREAARLWYASPAYQSLVPLRDASARTSFQLYDEFIELEESRTTE